LIPDSLATFVSFLLLLAPGIVWQLQRARYRPTVKESALIEVSRVVLASLTATGAAALTLAWIWLPLYRTAEERGSSALASPLAVVPYLGAVMATSLLACGLVLLVAKLKWPGKAPIGEGRIWSKALVDWRHEGAGPPYLIVELLDGTVWKGTILGFDSDPEDAQRNLALGLPLQRRQPGKTAFEAKGDQGRVVILPEAQIKTIQVVYPRPEVEPQQTP
jgi:hypothetical protein